MGGRVRAFVAGVARDCVRFRQECEKGICWRVPLDGKLLQVDDFVSVHDLLNQIACLLVVHGPDLLDALVIGLFKSLEALLQLDELVCEQLVVLRVGRVQILRIRLLHFEELKLVAEALTVFGKLGLQAFLLLLEDLLALEEDVVVEAQLLLVQLVNGLHVLHALLEDLHFSLQLDFLLGLLVRVLAHHVLQVSRILLLLFLPLRQVALLCRLVFDKELFDFLLVATEDGGALAVELCLDRLQLLVVVLAHLAELRLHASDKQVDVLRHLLDGLDVVAVLLVDLLFELEDQLLLVRDDL